MSAPTSAEVLRLYRNLLRYGKQLKFTDHNYYTGRIRSEFAQNKTLTSAEDIEFQFKVRFITWFVYEIYFNRSSLFFINRKGKRY